MTDFRHYKYSPFSQFLHWLTAVLVLVTFSLGPEGNAQRVYSAEFDVTRPLHETLGLAVFALSILRIIWKLVDKRPQPLALARWMEIASKAVQGVLYLLLLAVPLSAIFGAWFGGHALQLAGGTTIAPAVAAHQALGQQLAELHGLLGDLMLWLAGAHAAAAIYHQKVLKDGVMRTMLPVWVEQRWLRRY